MDNNHNSLQQIEIDEYIQQLDKLEKQAFLIAQDHLRTSFNICKSNGFKEWLKKKSIKIKLESK